MGMIYCLKERVMVVMERIKKKQRAHYLSVFLLFLAIGTFLDGITTFHAIGSLGIMEKNPIMSSVSPAYYLIGRVICISIIYYWGVVKQRTILLINIAVLIAAIWTWFIVFGNIVVISYYYFISYGVQLPGVST